MRTNIANVEHETRKGAIDHVMLLSAFIAPIFRKVWSSKSFRTWRRRCMKAGSQAYNLMDLMLLNISFISLVRESLF